MKAVIESKRINDRLPSIFRTAAVSVERARLILPGIAGGLFASPILILGLYWSATDHGPRTVVPVDDNSLMNGASVEGCFESTSAPSKFVCSLQQGS